MSKSIHNLDLSPKPGKQYWKNGGREWREEVIYFILADRFHDNHIRTPLEMDGKAEGFGSAEELQKTFGGTISFQCQ